MTVSDDALSDAISLGLRAAGFPRDAANIDLVHQAVFQEVRKLLTDPAEYGAPAPEYKTLAPLDPRD